jgi:2-phosphosulfolactate phosphatase
MNPSTKAQNVCLVWGENGVQSLAPGLLVVIVDVLSFSTAVDLACSRGAFVYPSLYRGSAANELAIKLQARLAVPREDVSEAQPISLSPGSMRVLRAGERLVLPSPNGATLSMLASQRSAVVLAGCLRNAASVAAVALSFARDIAIIAAGERWPDQSLRPAYEDLIGAGAILSRMKHLRLSPDAKAAVAAFEDAATQLEPLLLACESGQELVQRGFSSDVALASMLDQSDTVPILRGEAFQKYI